MKAQRLATAILLLGLAGLVQAQGPRKENRATAQGHKTRWAKTTGSVESVDAAASSLRLKEKSGMVAEFTAVTRTEVRRDKKHIVFSEIRPRDKVTLLRYDSATKEIKRIELASP